MQRNQFIKTFLLFSASIMAFPSAAISNLTEVKSNFKRIYSNSTLKASFYKFLQNVFNLYPEEKIHQLIANTTQEKATDKEIYTTAQAKLGDIKPFYSIFSHQLPSLFKQKDEMAKQAVTLLGKGTTYNGYLEIGSLGRYLDYLEEACTIKGDRYYADGKKPSYSIPDMIDRGQITLGATYIPMTDYHTDYTKSIPKDSLDLVTVYIGFHHCPVDLRVSFISSIRDVLRVGGKLVLRDHDCDTEDQATLVALAHDVFNMGTNETWKYNSEEIRNFYSLTFITNFIVQLGFTFNKQTLFQEGDPTKNALMLFTKI